jgi:hypothetical protein
MQVTLYLYMYMCQGKVAAVHACMHLLRRLSLHDYGRHATPEHAIMLSLLIQERPFFPCIHAYPACLIFLLHA